MPSRIKRIGQNIAQLASHLVVDPQGTTRSDQIDVKLQTVEIASRRDLNNFRTEIEEYLRGLEVPLPAGEIKPGHAWTAQRAMPMDDSWKLLQLTMYSSAWDSTDEIEMTYVYSRVRAVEGMERAIVRIIGRFGQRSSGNADGGGRVTGIGSIDTAKGQVIEQDVSVQVHGTPVMGRAYCVTRAKVRRE